MDEKEFPYDEFVDLYHLRWFVEESYKRMKSRLEIENYSGKTPLALLQDFYAKLFSCNLTSILMSGSDQQVEAISEKRNIEKKRMPTIKPTRGFLFFCPPHIY